ncbi:hypothetical protein K7432_008370 [Basidiobolus ranarum]|uniref:Uncharacterized protein n=1 Tax=Basidiobolus ranarum TaxID=34480 RepID=A0ABR2VYP1_9FUNG
MQSSTFPSESRQSSSCRRPRRVSFDLSKNSVTYLPSNKVIKNHLKAQEQGLGSHCSSKFLILGEHCIPSADSCPAKPALKVGSN